MHHARMIFEDSPAFIPVPNVLQHRKTEIIFLSLDEEDEAITSIHLQNSQVKNTAVTAGVHRQVFPDLADFRAKLPRQIVSAGEFCRAMRDENRY